jgi:hypothetical protein
VKREPYPTMEMMLKKMGNLEGHWNPAQSYINQFCFMILFLFFCSKKFEK